MGFVRMLLRLGWDVCIGAPPKPATLGFGFSGLLDLIILHLVPKTLHPNTKPTTCSEASLESAQQHKLLLKTSLWVLGLKFSLAE